MRPCPLTLLPAPKRGKHFVWFVIGGIFVLGGVIGIGCATAQGSKDAQRNAAAEKVAHLSHSHGVPVHLPVVPVADVLVTRRHHTETEPVWNPRTTISLSAPNTTAVTTTAARGSPTMIPLPLTTTSARAVLARGVSCSGDSDWDDGDYSDDGNDGYDETYDEGFDDGYDQGYDDAYDEIYDEKEISSASKNGTQTTTIATDTNLTTVIVPSTTLTVKKPRPTSEMVKPTVQPRDASASANTASNDSDHASHITTRTPNNFLNITPNPAAGITPARPDPKPVPCPIIPFTQSTVHKSNPAAPSHGRAGQDRLGPGREERQCAVPLQ